MKSDSLQKLEKARKQILFYSPQNEHTPTETFKVK